jgi:hypothetical protein
MPAAVAAAAPPLEPPQVRSLFQGLSVRPCSSLSVNQRIEKAGALVRPTMIMPDARMLAMTGLSRSAIRFLYSTTPPSVGQPFWSRLTLVVAGTPCSDPRASPRANALSAASAAANASSCNDKVMALIVGFTASRRFNVSVTTSRAETFLARINAAVSTPSSFHRSVMSPPTRPSAGPRRSRSPAPWPSSPRARCPGQCCDARECRASRSWPSAWPADRCA